MTRTGYADLKIHFDKLFVGGYPGNGLEQIRDVYKYAFGNKIHLYDIYQTNLRVGNNSICRIVTLIGPENDDIKSGIIPCIDSINCVSVFNKEYLQGLTSNNINSYIADVYDAMVNIMIADPLYNVSDPIARYNPYCAFLKCCPFYFTYHHIKYVNPDIIDNCTEQFTNILEKYICDAEDAPKVMESIAASRYSTDFEEIYSTMTCKGTVELFW